MTLREVIAAEIRGGGPIPFSRYMEMCLYHPELGYYSRGKEVFGKAGDFYTSSDVHAVFGRLMARQFEQMWRVLGEPSEIDVIEVGPGRGLFAADVLAWTARKFPAFARAIRYRLVEGSPALRDKLRKDFGGDSRVSVHRRLHELPECENTIVFGNEFFDALPIEVVGPAGMVVVEESEGKFTETFTNIDDQVKAFLDAYSIQPSTEQPRVEAPVVSQSYMHGIGAAVRRGFAVFFDYGYTREELLAGRRADTVRAFRQHSVSGNVYEAPGEQDITAHVNWTALRSAAAGTGLQPLGLVSQAAFLMGIGEANHFADALKDAVLPQERAKIMLQLKHLATPAGMGEMFQALVAARGVENPQLDGLKFA